MPESNVIGAELERVSTDLPILFEKDDTFFSTIEKGEAEPISKRDMRIPLKLRPGGQFGYTGFNGQDLGRGTSTLYDKAVINTVGFRHAIELTAEEIWATDDKRKAVINAFRDNLADAMKEFRRAVDVQCMTDGTGILGTITTVATSGGVDTYTFTTDGFRAKLFRYGHKVNLFNSTLTTCRTGGGSQNEPTITFVDLANSTIKVTPAVTGAVAGDLIGTSGLQSTPPVGFLGVKYHNSNSSSGTWLGMDRALNPEIRASRVNAASAALTLPLSRLAMNKIRDRIGNANKMKMTAWCHPAQDAAYEEAAQTVMHINKTSGNEDVNLYFGDNKRLAGCPMKLSDAWDRTRIDFIAGECWRRAEMHSADFYKNPENNNRLWETRGASGGVATAWNVYIVAMFNLYCNNPAGAAYIDNLAVPTGY